jgi:Pentapeptide repeats (9 copies)
MIAGNKTQVTTPNSDPLSQNSSQLLPANGVANPNLIQEETQPTTQRPDLSNTAHSTNSPIAANPDDKKVENFFDRTIKYLINTKQACILKLNEAVEDSDVSKVRTFFDDKAKYLRSDKLSQTYISLSFTESDAKSLNLSLDSLRLMFQSYCESPGFTPSHRYPKGNWWAFWNPKIIEEWNILNDRKFWTILGVYVSKTVVKAVNVSAGLSAMAFLLGLSGAENQKYLQAWQVINTADHQSGNGGRNEALQHLNNKKWDWDLFAPKCQKENNCLVGIKIDDANLNNVKLEKANLDSSTLTKVSFRKSKLAKSIFTNATLTGSVFTGADLDGVNFKGAYLQDVDFRGTNMTVNKLAGAQLCRTIIGEYTNKNLQKIGQDCKKN